MVAVLLTTKILSCALVALTTQLAGPVAVRMFSVNTQFVPATAKVRAPVPEPPVVVMVTDVPTALVTTVLEIERVACAPLKVKTTGSDVTLAYIPEAALVATTEQVVPAVAVIALRLIEQDALGVESA